MLGRAMAGSSSAPMLLEQAGRPRREPVLPARAYWLALAATPVMTFLIVRGAFQGTVGEAALTLLGTWVYTLAVSGALHATYTWGIPPLFARLPGWVPATPVHLVATAVAVGGVSLVIRPLVGLLCPTLGAEPGRMLLQGIILAWVFVLAALTYEGLRRQAREEAQRAQAAWQSALRAQLTALQARTNPHFLFNALSAVAGLIAEDPARAEVTLERLAALFRYALESSRQAEVALGEELARVRDYLEIEQVRFESRLAFEVEVEPGLEHVQVPPLLLQPLVENAVNHGVGSRREGGRVRVAARREGAGLVLAVVDDGPGPGGSQHRGTGTSMADLRERLRLLYGSESVLTTGPEPGRGYRAQLTLPGVEA